MKKPHSFHSLSIMVAEKSHKLGAVVHPCVPSILVLIMAHVEISSTTIAVTVPQAGRVKTARMMMMSASLSLASMGPARTYLGNTCASVTRDTRGGTVMRMWMSAKSCTVRTQGPV